VTSRLAKQLRIGDILINSNFPVLSVVELTEIESYGQANKYIIRFISTITHSMRPVKGEIPVYAKDLLTFTQLKDKKNIEVLHLAVSSIFDETRTLL
jgi:hypothetical protein